MNKSNYELYDELRDDIKESFKEAQAALDDFMEASENIQVVTNLKLYGIAYKCIDDTEESINNFLEFCDIEHSNFIEFLEDHHLELSYIGRTSSFYITPASSSGDRFIDIDLGYIYDEHILSEYDDVDDLLIDTVNSNVDPDDLIESLYDILHDLNIFMSDTLAEMKDDLKNVTAAYNYIENFKKYQLEYYENFLRTY